MWTYPRPDVVVEAPVELVGRVQPVAVRVEREPVDRWEHQRLGVLGLGERGSGEAAAEEGHPGQIDVGEGADPVVVAQVECLQDPTVEVDPAGGEVAGELVERLDLEAGGPDRRDPPVHGRAMIGVVSGQAGVWSVRGGSAFGTARR